MNSRERPPDVTAAAGASGSREVQQCAQDKARQHDSTEPQYRSRRAFIVWSVLAGFAPYTRLTEAVVHEIEAEA